MLRRRSLAASSRLVLVSLNFRAKQFQPKWQDARAPTNLSRPRFVTRRYTRYYRYGIEHARLYPTDIPTTHRCRSRGRNNMNRICSLLFALFLPALPAVDAEKIDNRDFAIDTCFPTPNEIRLAEARERIFWAKHSSHFGAEPRFLAPFRASRIRLAVI